MDFEIQTASSKVRNKVYLVFSYSGKIYLLNRWLLILHFYTSQKYQVSVRFFDVLIEYRNVILAANGLIIISVILHFLVKL